MKERVFTGMGETDTAAMDDDHPNLSDRPLRQARRPRVPFRMSVPWALGLIATVALAIVAGAAAVTLTVFGLAGVVLVLVAALVVIGATIWRRALLPLAVITLALALPATWAANSEHRVDRSRGTLIVKPRAPADVSSGTYRRGLGPVLVDLRSFQAPPGSTTRIAARADAGRLTVALPTDRCFNLQVRFHQDAITAPSTFALKAVRRLDGYNAFDGAALSAMGLTQRAAFADSSRSGESALAADAAGKSTLPYSFLGFNRWPAEADRYERPAHGEPQAPTLQLDLRSTQQMSVRDYPADVDPLAVEFSEQTGTPLGGAAWPEGLAMPKSPAEQSGRGALPTVRTPANRARWIAWENATVAWAKEQATRAAGPCASPDDLKARGFVFRTQPATVRTGSAANERLRSALHPRSQIAQEPVDAADTMLVVQVDGLGGTQVLKTLRRVGNALPVAR